MRHRVHLYTVARVAFDGIEAKDHHAAIAKARDLFADIPQSHRLDNAEDAEEIVGALVDEEGDLEFRNSRSYDFDKHDAPFSWRRVFNSEASNLVAFVSIACFIGTVALLIKIVEVARHMPPA